MAEDLDERDKHILNELVKNGDKSKAALAEELDMTRQGIFYKIKQLKKKGIIKKDTVDINNDRVGLGLRAFILVKTQARSEEEKELENNLKKRKDVAGLHLLFGDYELLVEIFVQDREELSEFVDHLQEFDDAVIRTKTLIVYNTLKSNHQHPVQKILEKEENAKI